MICVNGELVELNRFPDGTLNIEGNNNIWNGNVCISWKYDDDGELMAVAFLAGYYKARSNNVVLHMPYVPNAREDKPSADKIFTLKYFCQLINSIGFNEVHVFDPHSSVVAGLINKCVIHSPLELIEYVAKVVISAENDNKLEGDDLVVPVPFLPDYGSYKKYTDSMKVNPAFGIKHRKGADIELVEVLGANVTGMPVLIIDDIIGSGNTILESVKKLKELGAGNIYVYASHVENRIEENKELLDTVKFIVTTDSIYRGNNEKILVIHEVAIESDCECNCDECENCECKKTHDCEECADSMKCEEEKAEATDESPYATDDTLKEEVVADEQ